MFGSRQTTFGPTAKTLLVLFRQVSERQPEFFMLENVRTFPESLVDQFLGKYYSMEVLQTCPTQCGLPISRPRKYMLCRKKQAIPFFGVTIVRVQTKLDYNYC